MKKEGDKNQNDDEVIAFLDGIEGCEPCLTLRLDKLKKGEYYVLYRPDFKSFHKVKRLNLVFYSEFYAKRTESELNALRDAEREKAMFASRSSV